MPSMRASLMLYLPGNIRTDSRTRAELITTVPQLDIRDAFVRWAGLTVTPLRSPRKIAVPPSGSHGCFVTTRFTGWCPLPANNTLRSPLLSRAINSAGHFATKNQLAATEDKHYAPSSPTFPAITTRPVREERERGRMKAPVGAPVFSKPGRSRSCRTCGDRSLGSPERRE
jgi:hypothetical protein